MARKTSNQQRNLLVNGKRMDTENEKRGLGAGGGGGGGRWREEGLKWRARTDGMQRKILQAGNICLFP